MTFAETLRDYHRLERRAVQGGAYVTKQGVRGHPDIHPGAALIARNVELEGSLVDATGSAGFVALMAAQQGHAGTRAVVESSRAALRCVKETFGGVSTAVAAGAPWDIAKHHVTQLGRADAEHTAPGTIYLVPQTDRGTARVLAEVAGAHAALAQGGALYFALHKDQGAKRYEGRVAALFGASTLLAKENGWRLSRAVKQNVQVETIDPVTFTAEGLTLEAFPGVYAAGKLDPGTAFLLDTLDTAPPLGQRVLDLGCGYGLLALKASLAGASVTALDDDLLAVRSTHRNARRYGLDVRVLHSDVDSEIPGETFDAVLTNPPFHLGKQVNMALPRAFLAAAHTHLRPGGTLLLVANKALPYERDLARWASFEVVATNKQFKVLSAVKER